MRLDGFTLTFRLSANGCGFDDVVMVIVEKHWAGLSRFRVASRRRTVAMEVDAVIVACLCC